MLVPCVKILHIIECASSMGIIGDQFVNSVVDDLNIYYEQFPCVGTPKFQFHIDRIRLE